MIWICGVGLTVILYYILVFLLPKNKKFRMLLKGTWYQLTDDIGTIYWYRAISYKNLEIGDKFRGKHLVLRKECYDKKG